MPGPKAVPEFVSFLVDELADIGQVSPRRFFGGWQLLMDNNQFAIVMSGTVFFRVDGDQRAELERQGSLPFSYRKGEKTVVVSKYMSAPEAAMDDLDLLRDWTRRVIMPV